MYLRNLDIVQQGGTLAKETNVSNAPQLQKSASPSPTIFEKQCQ